MSWIILEGLDRTGKSSVADMYAKKYKHHVYHMSAPDKKYEGKDYIGPSYLDEIVDLYMSLSGKDVVFDRSPYGELVWPEIYGRPSQLSMDDLEILREIEDSNDCQRIWMHPTDTEAHWKRCVDNNEPLTRAQFHKACAYYERLESSHGFLRQELKDFEEGLKELSLSEKEVLTKEDKLPMETVKKINIAKNVTNQQIKLEKANAINDILTSKILKKKGDIYESIERDIRVFLQEKLSALFGNDNHASLQLTEDEIKILKTMTQRIQDKLGDKK